MTAKEESQEEVEDLAGFSNAILQAIAGMGNASMLAPFFEAVQTALAKGNLRGMRSIAKDVSDWARTLPPDIQQGLNEELRRKFGRTLDAAADETWQLARKALKRRRIEGDDEYRAVAQRVKELIEEKPSDATGRAIEELNALLSEHDTPGARA